MSTNYSNNSVVFSSNKPMAGIGFQVPENSTRSEWLKAAKLEWTIDEMPVSYEHNGKSVVDNSKKVLVRSDNSQLLHVASSRFKPVNNEKLFGAFFDIAENLNAKVEIIGEIDNGRKVFCRAKMPHNLEINGDKIEGYLTLATGNDGTMPTVANIGGNRLACMNQTPMLFRAKNNKHVTRHTTSFDPEKMIRDLGLAEYDESWNQFEDLINRLINKPVTPDQAVEIVHKLVGTKKDIADEGTRTKNTITDICRNMLMSAGSDLSTTHGTAWGVFNGISYYTDHQMGNSDNNRARGLIGNGDGNKIKYNALELLDMLKPKEQLIIPNNALELLGMH